MPDFDYRLLIALLLIIFASTLFSLARKLKNKIFKPSAPVFKTTFTVKDQPPLTFNRQMLIIPEEIYLNAKAAYPDIQVIPDIEPGKRLDLLEQLEAAFLDQQENKAFALAAIQTFRAWHSGLALTVFDPDHQLKKKERKDLIPSISKPGFDQFVFYRFLGIQNADLMPKTMNRMQDQYSVFFEEYPLNENEFLLAWAEQTMLTNRHLILFNSQKTPAIEHVIPLTDIESVSIEPMGMEKLN